jgi:hypothetical protein
MVQRVNEASEIESGQLHNDVVEITTGNVLERNVDGELQATVRLSAMHYDVFPLRDAISEPQSDVDDHIAVFMHLDRLKGHSFVTRHEGTTALDEIRSTFDRGSATGHEDDVICEELPQAIEVAAVQCLRKLLVVEVDLILDGHVIPLDDNGILCNTLRRQCLESNPERNHSSRGAQSSPIDCDESHGVECDVREK